MTARSRTPRPPAHLKEAGQVLWRAVTRSYELEDHDLAILAAACEAADRAAAARVEIDRDGITIEGRYGRRANPAIQIERDSRLSMLKALRELGLNAEPAAEPRPLPAQRGRR